MRTRTLTLEKNAIHINPYLTHWTGRGKTADRAFEILGMIINGKRLRFAPNKTSYPQSKVLSKVEMICFTDTPIEQSADHCRIYNQFGISFNKERMMALGANPVLYIVPEREQYLDFYNMENVLGNNILHETNQEKMLFGWFSALFQPYKTDAVEAKGFAEYLEREWRVNRILPSRGTLNSIKYGGGYEENLEGEVICELEGDKEVFYLEYALNIIENIIVPETYRSQAEELMKKNNLKCELLILTDCN